MTSYTITIHVYYVVDLEVNVCSHSGVFPGRIFGTMISLYLMACSIQKKMIAQLCLGFNELRAFKIHCHLNNCHILYI